MSNDPAFAFSEKGESSFYLSFRAKVLPGIILFVCVTFLGMEPARAQTPQIIEAAWKKSVTIFVYDKSYRKLANGSGFLIGDKGEIATNNHVIEVSGAAYASAKFPDSDKLHTIRSIIRKDRFHDLAVLRIDLNTTALPLGANDDYTIGQKITSIGSPQGLSGTVSDGIISSRRVIAGFEHMQITTPISPGSSGGPVINENGEVIGVVVGSILSGQNLNFAVPVKHLKNLLAAPGTELPLANAFAEGTKLWEFETGGWVDSSPAIGSDGTVYVGSDDSKLYAIDGKTGTKLWEFETGSIVQSSPAIGSDGTVYVGSYDNKLYAIDGKSGAKLWEFETDWFVSSSPAIGSDGTVYLGSFDNKLYAINGKTGAKLWEFVTGADVRSSPAIGSDGTVYIGSDDNKLYAIHGKTGVKLWEFETGADVPSSPAIGSDGAVYVGSRDNKLYAIHGQTGAKLWEFETGNWVTSSPAIGSDGTVYVGSDDSKLYAIDGKSGAKLWEFEMGSLSMVNSSPAIGSDGTVYVGSWNNKLYAIDGKTGTKLWEFKTGSLVLSSPAIGSDGTVYVGSYDKKLYAIQGSSGPATVAPWPMRGQNAHHTGRTTAWSIVSLTSTPGGTGNGGGILEKGSSATLSATPDLGYLFTGWSGDANGADNPLPIVSDSDMTIVANFAKDTADDDGDGLSNYAELVTHGTKKDDNDTDDDGLSDGDELQAGLNPKSSDAPLVGFFNARAATRETNARTHALAEGRTEGILAVKADPSRHNLVTKDAYDQMVEELINSSATVSTTPFVHGWFYYPSRGWLFTNRTTFPFFYDSSTKSWMYFKSGEDKPRFYHYDTKSWFTLEE